MTQYFPSVQRKEISTQDPISRENPSGMKNKSRHSQMKENQKTICFQKMYSKRKTKEISLNRKEIIKKEILEHLDRIKSTVGKIMGKYKRHSFC